jgi:uncharacterized protein (TIGR00369 family)
MKKIVNPFSGLRNNDYQCFGCSPNNSDGLHLQFWDDGEKVKVVWQPLKKFEGYMGVLHGGIQATIFDEIASWTIYTKCHTAGVTSRMNVTYRKPVMLSKGEITIEARVREFSRRMAIIACELYDSENQLCSEADVTYICFPENVAREKYMYPGADAFYENP